MWREKNKKKKTPVLLMKNKGQIEIIAVAAIILILVVGGGFYYNNKKNITGQTINELKDLLEEQGELTAEQERELEELAEVTCKDVQVPYDAQEEYTEQEPYTDDECENINLEYKLERGSCLGYKDNLIFDDEPARHDCTVSNLDSVGGNFIIKIGFSMGEQQLINSQGKYIYPQSENTFYAEEMAEIDTCSCSMETIPTKTICETVTKYNTVKKYRTVTKYRTETVCE